MLVGIDASRAVTDRPTGTEAYARELIKAIIPQAYARGHQVRLYFNEPPAEPISPYSHQTCILPARRLWTHTRLAWELAQNKPDIFFTPAHVIPLTYWGASVATIHDVGFRHFPEAHPPKQRAYLEWSTKHNARRSSLVFADSLATKQDIIDSWGISAEKIAVLYPGRDESLQPVTAEKDIEMVLDMYGILSPYLLYIGTLQPRKNLVRLIEAFCSVADQIPHQLVLAGNQGWLSTEIVAAARNLPDRICLTGFVDEQHKATLISGATALLFPSLYEGFGFPVLEGFGCNTAVLTSNTSSLPEVAGEGAHLVNPLDHEGIANGILKLSSDEGYRTQLQKYGNQQLLRFDWETCAAEALNLLEKVKV